MDKVYGVFTEEMVDWIAIQLPKICEACKSVETI